MEENEIKIPSIKEALGIVIFTFIFSIIIGLVNTAALDEGESLINFQEFQTAEFLIFLPLFLYLLYKKYPFKQTLRLRAIPLKVVGYSIVIGISATILISELDYLISIFFPVPEKLMENIENLMTIHNWGDGFIIILSTVVGAGILEEMLFRGFFQQAVEHQKRDVTYAVFFTALLFSLFHIPWWYLQSTVMGIILGVMAWKSNSVLPCIIAHAINNLIGVVLLNIDQSHYKWYEWRGHISPPFIILASFGIVWGFHKLYRYYDYQHYVYSTDEE